MMQILPVNQLANKGCAPMVGGLRILLLALLALTSFRVAAQTNFATLVNDGAWTWFNDPRALFHNGQLYYGYVRSDGKSALSSFNLTTGVNSNLWVSGFTQADDHNNPGLLARQDGRLLAIYSLHGSANTFSYRRSDTTNPVSPADWAAEQIIASSGAGVTYANPFQLSAEAGKIYNFCRNTNYNPTVFTSTDGGSNWSAPQWFIRTGAGGTRPYVKYCSDYTNRIDFLYTDGHPRDVANSLYHLYYRSNAFYQTDGTFVKSNSALPLLHDSNERGYVLYQYSAADASDPNDHIPTGRAWCWETAYQTDGAPVCVFTVQRDNIATSGSLTDRIYYYYARWTGSAWQKRFIAQAGRPLYNAEDDYAGGICVDPQDPNVIYISSNAQDPFNLTDTTNVALRASERYELWRGVTGDGGLTFAWTQITTNSEQDNLRPYVPRRNGGEPCVIWFRGTYSTYQSYACSIVGRFSTQVPNNQPVLPPVQPITYVDATSGVSGNTTLADGSTFSPPLNGTTGTDNDWEQRTVFGSGGNIFESGGEAVEDAPELKTTISGLIAGANYSIYVHFWDPTSTTEDWNIRAGFSASPGNNTLFSANDSTGQLNATAAVPASSLVYASAPTIFIESGRALLAGWVGNATPNGNGQIEVFLDDLPSAIGANNRTWYDGVGYALHPAANPTNLTAGVSNNLILLSWPPDHAGWVLQTQTNNATTGLQGGANFWFDVPGSPAMTATNFPVVPGLPVVFFRIRSP
jgi:hypothetical protein